ncbi:MAG: flagellar assembly peptidoglycan hydrolase FlgJ [Nitrosomonadales bacterium]|nr:flagellar assembly peptidoglycan hydrolase FlgJ [Nitrosomonadales bacterium]
MNIQADIAGSLAASSQSLDSLRNQAKASPDQALRAAARQFESVFMNMMLKSMRDATPQDGMFDSEQTKMFTGMLDQQLAQNMASRGIGLADIMVRQLSRTPGSATMPQADAHIVKPSSRVATPKEVAPVARSILPSAYSEGSQQDFVQRMTPYALQASQETGVPAPLMLGQAALESGWGRREIRMVDGSNSYNLFGIKATGNWNGKVAEVVTTEYHGSVASRQVQKFRAYDSYAEAFSDYAHLLCDNPRYAPVMQPGQGGAAAAQALQRAGYATDPNYADKLVRVMSRISAAG